MATRLTDAEAQARREERAWHRLSSVMDLDRVCEIMLRVDVPNESEKPAIEAARTILNGVLDCYCSECRHVTDVNGVCECCREEQRGRAAMLDARDKE